ncbi:MBL fold metallo-hydrolase [Pedobacter arcticus]|uniref:MBL fold metallo-hydrolase n=1 Tax=Pedobacter arcticus TaxID=752140 RepID=UPI0002EA778F|nr:MBL fold metallo-hydrolase [Pedobacter arcticus]
MLIYTSFAIAIIAFIILSFLNKAVFGAKPNTQNFEELPNFSDGTFQNQSSTPMLTENGTYLKLIPLMLKRPKSVNPAEAIQVVKTDLKSLALSENCIVWFGHSSYLMILDGKRILVDPVFHEASPLGSFGKPYSMSYLYTPADFPEIDILVITHDHYDHLDYKAVCELRPKVKNTITGKGVNVHLKLWGYPAEQITALNWNETALVAGFEFTCLPARHFSGRKFKRGQTLWSSFALKTPQINIYIGGDSGYDTHFKEIGEKHGPFDLAILECGQYNKYWNLIHMMPEQTLKASKDLNAAALLPVHWGKFTLSVHPWTEPVERLLSANTDGAQNVFTPRIGEVLFFGKENTTVKWWLD